MPDRLIETRGLCELLGHEDQIFEVSKLSDSIDSDNSQAE
jgi:hypothetical protein